MQMCIECFHLTMKSLVNLCNLLLQDVVVEVGNVTTSPRHSLYCTLVNTYFNITNYCRNGLVRSLDCCYDYKYDYKKHQQQQQQQQQQQHIKHILQLLGPHRAG